jgi:hypothetical protein
MPAVNADFHCLALDLSRELANHRITGSVRFTPSGNRRLSGVTLSGFYVDRLNLPGCHAMIPSIGVP